MNYEIFMPILSKLGITKEVFEKSEFTPEEAAAIKARAESLTTIEAAKSNAELKAFFTSQSTPFDLDGFKKTVFESGKKYLGEALTEDRINQMQAIDSPATLAAALLQEQSKLSEKQIDAVRQEKGDQAAQVFQNQLRQAQAQIEAERKKNEELQGQYDKSQADYQDKIFDISLSRALAGKNWLHTEPSYIEFATGKIKQKLMLQADFSFQNGQHTPHPKGTPGAAYYSDDDLTKPLSFSDLVDRAAVEHLAKSVTTPPPSSRTSTHQGGKHITHPKIAARVQANMNTAK